MKLTGDDGREYLDFLAGIGVCSLGHGDSAVLSALEAQTKKLLHVSNYFYIEQRGQVAALLSKLANDDVDGARVLADAIAAGDETTAAALGAPAADEQVWETFFANSGAEANEGSMKLARLYAKRAGNGGNTIVCMRGGFHGRTLETIAATMQDWLQDSFRPLPGGFVACTPNDVDELCAIFEQLGSEICAVMLEPIQGESGVHPMTEEFMAAARDLAHDGRRAYRRRGPVRSVPLRQTVRLPDLWRGARHHESCQGHRRRRSYGRRGGKERDRRRV